MPVHDFFRAGSSLFFILQAWVTPLAVAVFLAAHTRTRLYSIESVDRVDIPCVDVSEQLTPYLCQFEEKKHLPSDTHSRCGSFRNVIGPVDLGGIGVNYKGAHLIG